MKNENSSLNENTQPRKKAKGMTLVEVLVSLAVMAVLALMLVTIGITIDTYHKKTREKNQKVFDESPRAESRNISEGVSVLVDDDFKVVVNGIEVEGKVYSAGAESDGSGGYVEADGNHLRFARVEPITATP